MDTRMLPLLAALLAGCATDGGTVVSGSGHIVADHITIVRILGHGCRSGLDANGNGDTQRGGGAEASVPAGSGGLEAGAASAFAGALATVDDCTAQEVTP